jgi:hypothetical protein
MCFYPHGFDKPTHTVDYIFSNKLITKNSFVLLHDETIGRVIKFQSGVICFTKEGERNFKYKDLKSILLFATNNNIYVNSVVLMNNEFFVVREFKDGKLVIINHLDELIEVEKEMVKKFSGIIKTDRLLQVGDKISGIESGRIFQEGVSYYNDVY